MKSILDFYNTPQEEMKSIANRFKVIRRSRKISQSDMAIRSNVSLGSIKRFERTGEISLSSLIKLAFALNLRDEFNSLFEEETKVESLYAW